MSGPRRSELVFYAVVRGMVEGVCRMLWRARVLHGERVPAQGPYILAPSHRSILDTPFTSLVTRRRARFMGKAELWRWRGPGRVFSALGAFPVDRAATDRAAIRNAVAALEGGEPLVIFPEGTRRHGPLIEDLHDGVAYVAARCRVPIVPVGIGGSEEILARGRKLPRLKRVVVVVGEPLAPPGGDGPVKRGAVTALTEQLQADLQVLFDEAEALAQGRPGSGGR
ncbi:MAG: lysophospholipid acyltransferase family protein [Acidimicrobiia bacterium]